MKRIFALALVFVMIFTLFTSCGVEPEDIIGTWSTTTDLAEKLNDSIDTTGTLKKALTIKELKRVTLYTYKEDGTYESRVDTDALAESIKTARAEIKNQFASTFGSIESANKLFADSGSSLTVDALIDIYFSEDVIKALVGQPVAGKYLVEDSKLYLSTSLSKDVDKDSYIEIDISDDELIYEGYEGKGTEDLKEQTFKRVK